MPKNLLATAAVLIALAAGSPAAAQAVAERTWTRANDTRRIDFPVTASGNLVLAVDTHTHSLFSDGVVWPTVRLWEAEQDNLAAYAVTDHMEHQIFKADLPTLPGADRNRPYEIALKEAARIKSRVQPINGAEITREPPWGHFNALFLKDADAIPSGPESDPKADPRPSLKAAREQDAFIIWNHAWASPGLDQRGAGLMPAEIRKLVADQLIDAMEIANSSQYSADAFAVALKHGLAVIGASDVHTAIDADHQIPEGQHRTVTLVLSPENTPAAIREAMLQKRTAALFRRAIYGRERELSEIVGGALRVSGKKRVESFLTKDIVEVELHNDAFMPFQIRFVQHSPLNSPRIITLPAHGKVAIQVANVADIETFALEAEVLNAFIEPDRSLTLLLR